MSSPAQANTASPELMQTVPGQPTAQGASGGLDPQMQAQIKAQMADIIEPAAVGIWPLAWGWWLLMGLVVIAVAIAVGLLLRHRRNNRYRRQALHALGSTHFENRQQQCVFLMRLSKQVALAAYPNQRESIAKANGDQWLNWLNRTTPSPLFDGENARRWQHALYSPPNQDAADGALTDLIQRWIKTHTKQLPREGQNV
ncbi:MAG TPA: DUF4381 domain-containing protein [Marinagarivorans sp.]